MQKIILSLPVADVSRSVEFYRHLLGFNLVGVTGKGGMTRARMRYGVVELLFRSVRSDYTMQLYGRIDPDDRMMLYFMVDDVLELYHRVRPHVQIVREYETTLFGAGEFAMEDLDGNVLSFSQTAPPPAAPAGARSASIDLDSGRSST